MIIVVAVAALLTTGGVSAEPAPSVEAGDVSLALVEAMKYSVANDPNVKLAQEAKLASFGAVDQNMGPFDPILGLSLIHISEPTRLVHSSRMPSSA